jgi:hypothetical protein
MRIAWAVTTAGRRLPFQTTCLVDGLVARVMLRRRGYLARLRLGVQPRSPEGSLKAHAWVECDGKVVVGHAEDLHRYTPLQEQQR